MIYLDHHSTTACDETVVQAMVPWMMTAANPHSAHAGGVAAAEALGQATEHVGKRFGIDATGVIWTSGATESVNLALLGAAEHPRMKRRTLVTTTIEHPCVLRCVEKLARGGWEIRRIGVDRWGRLDMQRCLEAIDDSVGIVSIGYANNEIGVIADVPTIAAAAKRVGAITHTDATQIVPYRDIDLRSDAIDLLSASSHKFYGPRGCGMLMVRDPATVRIAARTLGGGQQSRLRSGTVDVAGAIGTAVALSLVDRDRQETDLASKLKRLRRRLWDALTARIEGIELNGPDLESSDRLPNNLNFRVREVQGETWASASSGVAFSSGSACSSVEPEPSHVLTAMGLSEDQARRSVRFGLGRRTTEAEIDSAVEILRRSYSTLKSS